MKILIVEDEAKAGEYLKQGLQEAGFTVEWKTNGTDGLHTAREGDYDLLILDVMLPGLNGWQVLQQLRQEGRQVPVLFLTARDEVQDRVRGLELGGRLPGQTFFLCRAAGPGTHHPASWSQW